MPNWCVNRLTVKGPVADVASFREKAVGYPPWLPKEVPDPLNFHSLLPVPADLVANEYSEAAETWERDHWGCKWGAAECELIDAWPNELIYGFQTAWSPPIEFLKAVSQQWPTLVFLLDYEEPGECFKGICKAHQGQVEDHCLTY